MKRDKGNHHPSTENLEPLRQQVLDPFLMASSNVRNYSAIYEIERILMEEDNETHDTLDIQAVQGSFHDVLGENLNDKLCNLDHLRDSASEQGDNNNSLQLPLSVPNTFCIQNSVNWGEIYVHFSIGLEEGKKFLPPMRRTLGISRKNRVKNLKNDRTVKMGTNFEDDEIWKKVDQIFLNDHEHNLPPIKFLHPISANEQSCQLIHNKMPLESGISEKINRMNKRRNAKKVDLENLLLSCARAVANDDHNIAYELLNQIRQHSFPFEDGSQKCAHYFANGLEARLSGTGTYIYNALNSNPLSPLELFKTCESILLCHYRNVCHYFTTYHLLKLVEKSKTLHILDFGIGHGFHWGAFIQYLSTVPGGSPKLRFTGIELPSPSLRPDEIVKKTGHRLSKYCARFNVPFEYNGIAKKWETIELKDFNIDPTDAIAVTCIFRLEKLLDEVAGFGSPRNKVLRLIRKINPEIFIHSIVNGTYNTPMFFTRFRAALFHYWALFEMFSFGSVCETPEKLLFERNFIGRDILNVVACEGFDRVNRPETYKQWQLRASRAGFHPLPLDAEFVRMLKSRFEYNKDCSLEIDGHWCLQGWKGRQLFATCCWTPTNQA